MTRISSRSAALAVALACSTGLAYAQSSQSGSAGQTGSRQDSTPAQGAGAVSATAGRSDSRTFVNQLSIAGMAEVQLGRMASERGQSADVKAFGQMMVKDHTQAGQELTQIASQLQIQPPADLDQKHKDLVMRLSQLRGAEFDREYMKAMVEGHQEVVDTLRARTGNQSTSNPSTTGDRASTSTSGTSTSATTSASNSASNSAGASASTSRSESGAPGAVGTSGAAAGDQALTQWAVKTLPVVQQHLARAREIEQKVR